MDLHILNGGSGTRYRPSGFTNGPAVKLRGYGVEPRRPNGNWCTL